MYILRPLLLFALLLLLSEPNSSALEIGGIRIDDSDQSVKVSKTLGQWRHTKDGAAIMVPMLNVNFDCGNFNYSIRHDGGGPYPNGLGISYPSRLNWYQSDGFALLINDQAYASGAGSNEKLELIENGKRADAVFNWDNDVAALCFDFNVHYLDQNLYLLIELKPHIEVHKLKMRLRAFPGGMLPGGKSDLLQVYSNQGEQQLQSGKNLQLPPDLNDQILLYRSEDFIEKGIRGGCGVIFSGSKPLSIEIKNGFFCELILEFSADTRRIGLALNEFVLSKPLPLFQRKAKLAASRLPDLHILNAP
ncbi:MAG: hypothetical protein GX901_09445 [Lentisphaerae bacterium]|nr:hypothetical protein [Lentisphaerota bacterium]